MKFFLYKYSFFFLLLCYLIHPVKGGVVKNIPAYKFKTLTNNNGLTHNTVFDIAQDSSGTIWIATKEGLNKYNSYEMINYYTATHPELASNNFTCVYVSSDNRVYAGSLMGLTRYSQDADHFENLYFNGKSLGNVRSISEDRRGNLFIGTQEGLYKYYPEKDLMVNISVFKNYNIQSVKRYREGFILATTDDLIYIDSAGVEAGRYNRQNTKGLGDGIISCIFIDQNKKLLVGTENLGVFLLMPEKAEFSPLDFRLKKQVGSTFVRSINEDDQGNYWIGTEAGLYIYNPKKQIRKHISHSLEKSEYSLNDNAVYTLYQSRENIMWIGTYFGGINYTFLNENKGFYHIYPGIEKGELPGKAVNSIIQTKEGKLWIATEDGGIFSMCPDTRKIIRTLTHKEQGNSISSNNIHALCEDNKGNIWIGFFTNGIDIYNPKTEKFTHILPNPELKSTVFGNSVYSLMRDFSGNIWTGTRSGIKKYDPGQKRFKAVRPDILTGFFYNILQSQDKSFWFCSRHDGIFRFFEDKDSLIHYSVTNRKDLKSDRVISATEDRLRRIWFGTIGGGAAVYLPEKDSFFTLTMEQGLPNNTIYGILEGENDELWLSSNNGLCKYNAQTGEIRNFSLQDGLSQKQFNFGSYFKSNTGTLYFGTINGLTYFNPASIKVNTVPSRVIFTDILLFNKSLKIGRDKILKKHINETKKITLKYSQNVITINFVAVNHSSPGTNRFIYKLDNFDKKWNVIDNRTSVTYTNLTSGSYIFKLKAINNDGIESTNTKKLEIEILRPWWFTNIALLSYIVFLLTLIIFFRNRAIRREKERSVLKLEKLEKEKIKELNQQRLNFFTYISHEFKTPLSVILASLEELTGETGISPEKNKNIGRLRRSANRLSFLITQLMDFRKIETRHARLNLHKADIVRYIQETCLVFSPIFEKKKIDFSFVSNKDKSFSWFDPDKIEKIVTNLISNAIKFTSENDRINCEIVIQLLPDTNAEELTISISDTGSGIKKENLHKLFDHFYKFNETDSSTIGTGIGLSLVKSLVEYLNGKIEVQSIYGKGTNIIVTLPLEAKKAPDVILEKQGVHPSRNISLEHLMDDSNRTVSEIQSASEKDFHMLIVEDTLDLAEVLIEHFSRNYKISFAKNGEEALKLIQHETPDLIISDIMMPGMDGLELCENLKSRRETSHIAIILLTARQTREDRISGLSKGAEAFITKPFDFKELDLVVKNFLATRTHLKKELLLNKEIDLSKVKIHDRDKSFIENSTQIITKNLENENFSVEDLAQNLGMSTTLVYLKHKKLLDVSPKEYIQMLRFKKAIELMLTTGFSISEIAYKVGFTDPNYFSKAFKKTYQKTPTSYREELIQKAGNI